MDEKRARFAAEVLPHLDAAYRLARWLTRTPEDADDVVQEAVLRAFRGFDSLRNANAKAWLMTIVRNCHFTAVSQQRRRAHVPLPDENDAQDGHVMTTTAAGPETDSILRDDRDTLDRLIATLPEEQRTVLMLREIEEMDYREIAQITNLPMGTVMSRLARSRAALRARWLQEAGGEPRAVR